MDGAKATESCASDAAIFIKRR
ncbi:hypothetical protein CGLO_17769 [Colletotrichum gloeosporioides Cg-14]|uniref:Uncharacterized protein n=1 Tax=Colletotrichum gloeosporioides (strain Cg-14) TaxID=1237896 RepID=T0JK64_COLGC|nr:hypothetical protein CGLO_17769 [Colletotrichum gloeosporioides Cg-14]